MANVAEGIGHIPFPHQACSERIRRAAKILGHADAEHKVSDEGLGADKIFVSESIPWPNPKAPLPHEPLQVSAPLRPNL
ncbi:MAG: hypothetical protein MAG451_02802 [Anaerolineales bacterium]|nr:hypothetical protein [Anaerolineales bacterium]